MFAEQTGYSKIHRTIKEDFQPVDPTIPDSFAACKPLILHIIVSPFGQSILWT
jgi:hypothetical protein